LSLFEKVREAVSEQLKVAPGEIKPDSLFIDDLGADSLDTVELVMALEDKFGIEISDEDAEKMVRVNDLIKYIESKAKPASN